MQVPIISACFDFLWADGNQWLSFVGVLLPCLGFGVQATEHLRVDGLGLDRRLDANATRVLEGALAVFWVALFFDLLASRLFDKQGMRRGMALIFLVP